MKTATGTLRLLAQMFTVLRIRGDMAKTVAVHALGLIPEHTMVGQALHLASRALQ